MERHGGGREGKERWCEKTERDEGDYINQDGNGLKRKEACLVSLRDGVFPNNRAIDCVCCVSVLLV